MQNQQETLFRFDLGKTADYLFKIRRHKDRNLLRRRYLEGIWKQEKGVIEGLNVEREGTLHYNLSTLACFVRKFKWSGIEVSALVLLMKYTLGFSARNDIGKRQSGNRGEDQKTRHSEDFLWVYVGQNDIHLNAFVKWKKNCPITKRVEKLTF